MRCAEIRTSGVVHTTHVLNKITNVRVICRFRMIKSKKLNTNETNLTVRAHVDVREKRPAANRSETRDSPPPRVCLTFPRRTSRFRHARPSPERARGHRAPSDGRPFSLAEDFPDRLPRQRPATPTFVRRRGNRRSAAVTDGGAPRRVRPSLARRGRPKVVVVVVVTADAFETRANRYEHNRGRAFADNFSVARAMTLPAESSDLSP